MCSEEESDDEDDDEEELQAELQRIKAEREQAQVKKLQEDEELELRLKRESAMRGNPLAMIEENSAKVRLGFCVLQFCVYVGALGWWTWSDAWVLAS
jgi:hypothetical protein